MEQLSFNDGFTETCYHEAFLHFDLENMGFFFEYCEEFVEEQFGVTPLDKVAFCTDFLLAPIRKEIDKFHPKLMYQAAQSTVRDFVNVDLKGDLTKYIKDTGDEFYPYEMYWCGEMYCVMHFMTKKYSHDIVKKFPISEMRELYILGHEMDIFDAYHKLEPEVNKRLNITEEYKASIRNI